ncbi:ABC transporter permease [Parapedobacter defluvii]|uniref:ABC transporter permease n=1 Tax=Parapedobacter defluvii TaxID=2045106 RepID=A0ABQ1LA42_9SPHI|nr:ABC transporter permease [Parapedobacter defluvii]GGC20337.1 ABC transporter permease [Parapedobacter defluvii]
MRTFIQLVKREFRLFWGNSVLRLLFIGAPVLYGVLFGFVYQKGKVTDLNILVVDQDNTPLSNRLVDMLNDNEVLHVVEVKPERMDLKRDLIRLDGQAIVIIPDRFEADVLQNRSPEINVQINLANILTANYASRSIQVVLGSLNAGLEMEALRKRGTPDYAVSKKYEAFSTNYVRLYNRSSNYMSFLWPGMLATIVQQVLLLALALSFAQEYERGTFQSELLAQTRSPLLAILVKCMPYWLMMIPIGLFFWGLQQYFHIPLIPHQPGASLLLFALFVAASSFMGILVSILIPNQLKATEVLMVVATPSFVLSGFTWPLSQMPGWVALVADVIPLTHFLSAYRIMLMQEGWLGAIGSQLIALAILTVVFGLLSYAALAIKMRRVK